MCVCVCVLPSAAGNLITALMHKRERGEAVVRKRNAVLQFLFSLVMRRGLPGLFKCLMRLGNVKAAVVIQEKQDWMDAGHTSAVVAPVHMHASVFTCRRGEYRLR